MGPTRFATLGAFVLCSALLLASQPLQDAALEDGAAADPQRPSVPRFIRFSGMVRGTDAEPRSGAVGLTFAIYAEHQGGAPVWLETQNVQLDQQGRYSVLLGRTSPGGLPLKLFAAGEARWLGVRVAEDGAAEQPRVALVSVPYALTAADAQTLGGRPASAYQLTRAAARLETDEADVSAAGSGEVSGTINSTANTLNRVAKFTATDTIGDSLIFDNGTNVGIGTTSPASPLHVEANNTSAAMRVVQNNVNGFALLVRPSNDATPAFLMNNAANSANKHVFYGSGDAGLGLGGGRIGIGTTGPASPLHVDANNTSAAVRIVQNNPAGFALLVQPSNDGNPAFLMNNAANTANRHVFYGSGEALFALGGGNVGIGTNAPTQKLHVAGQVYSSTGGFRFPDNTVQTTAATGGSGDITAVTAGTGLSGGGTSGDVALAVNTSVIQARVTGTCATNTYVRVINSDGTVTCGTDQSGGGGITYPYTSGDQSTPSGAFTITQTNSVLIGGEVDVTFSQIESSIPGAVVGRATATSNTVAGVVGTSVSPDGVAIVGWNNASTGDANGILGLTQSTSGKAIGGIALATTGQTVGVEGESDSSSGKGLRGRANSLTGSTIGVEGKVDSTTGTAGMFIAPAGSSAYVLRGNNNSQDVFKVDANGTVFASGYRDLSGNPIPSGTVTGVTAGTGLSGGTINTSGTISLNTTFTDGRYGQLTANNVFTGTNSFGRVTAGGTASPSVEGSSNTSIGVYGYTNAASTTGNAGVVAHSFGSAGVGLRASVTSGNSIVALFNNEGGGQIISGRAANVEKFAVDGNGEITTRSVTAASMKADKLVIPAISFNGFAAAVSPAQAVVSPGDHAVSTPVTGWAAVTLPNGSVVTGFTFCGRDNDSPGQIIGSLKRRPITGVDNTFATTDTLATVASGTSTGNSNSMVCLNTTSISNATIDNTLYAYYAEITLNGLVQAVSVQIDH